jgi:hypothetical protein
MSSGNNVRFNTVSKFVLDLKEGGGATSHHLESFVGIPKPKNSRDRAKHDLREFRRQT